jgi:flagellar biosynthetic protein FlhB
MAEKSAAEKTEQPTPRKISKAREQGQIPQSQEFVSAALLLVIVFMITLMAPSMMNWLSTQLRQGLSPQDAIFDNNASFMSFVKAKIIDCFIFVSPFFAGLIVVSFLASVVVSGFSFSPAAINLKFDSINPVKGFQKLVNLRSFVHLGISVVKLLFITLIVWFYLSDKMENFAALRWEWSAQILEEISKLVFGVLIRICIAMLIIGIADFAFQKWKYIQELKMTRQEVKEERKDTEGSPEVKVRIRRIQFQMTAKRMLKAVPKANVVLVNPTHYAVALQYDAKTMDAPVVVAKGADHLAQKIIEIARSYGIPVVRRPELARAIYKTVEPGSPVPEILYIAVAEVLAMVYRLRHSNKA